MSLNLRPPPRPRRRRRDSDQSLSCSSEDTIVSSEVDRFGRPLAKDDVHLRAPIVLAPTQINPLVQADKLDSQLTSKTWRLATTGKDRLVDGRRYENALWRLWAQQRLGIRRVDGLDFDWDQLLEWNHRALLGPVVISHETAHSKAELLLAYSVDATPLDYPLTATSITPSDGSACASDAYRFSYGTNSVQQIPSHEPDRTPNSKFISGPRDMSQDEQSPRAWNVRSVLSYIRNASPARNLFSSSNTAGGYFTAPPIATPNSHGHGSSSSSTTGPGTPPAPQSHNGNVILLEDGTLLRPCITRRVSSSSERSWSTAKSSVSPASERRQYVGGGASGAQGRTVKFNNCVTRGAYAVDQIDGSRQQDHELDEDDDQHEHYYSPPLVAEAIDEEESDEEEAEDETPVETPALGVLTALNNALVHLPPLPIPNWLRVPGISTPPIHPSTINNTPPVVSTPPVHGGNIELLPPTHLCPVAEVEERGSTVVFVPPEGMEQLCEDDLVPLPPKADDDDAFGGASGGRGRSLTRNNRSRSCLDLTLHAEDDTPVVDEMEMKLAELGMGSTTRRMASADTMTMVTTTEGTNIDNDDEGDNDGQPENDAQSEPEDGVASRRSRRRKSKSTFILREEDEE